jgi:equilibrative nucleoside transporter 1/2/3
MVVYYDEYSENTPLSPQIKQHKEQVPKDSYSAAYIILMIMGVGSLLPGFVYLLSLDFYFSVFPDFREISYVFSFGFNAGQVIALGLLIFLESRTTLQFRLFFFYTINLIGLALSIGINYYTSTDSGMEVHFWAHKASSWTLVVINTVLGISCGALIGACFSLAGRFPSRYFSAVMTGISAAGIVTATLRIGSKGIQDATGNHTVYAQMVSTNIYFALATLIQVICIVGTFLLLKLPITRHVTREKPSINEEESEQETNTSSAKTWLSTFRHLLFPGLAVFTSFFVTLSIYPGLIVDIRSQNSHFQQSWSPVLLLACYALCDFLGRTGAGLKQFSFVADPFGRKISWVLVYIRAMLMYPIFFLLIRYALHIIDPVKFAASGLLGFSGGYLGSIGMQQGGLLGTSSDPAKSGVIMTFWLNVGCFLGSLFALLLGYLATLITVI